MESQSWLTIKSSIWRVEIFLAQISEYIIWVIVLQPSNFQFTNQIKITNITHKHGVIHQELNSKWSLEATQNNYWVYAICANNSAQFGRKTDFILQFVMSILHNFRYTRYSFIIIIIILVWSHIDLYTYFSLDYVIPIFRMLNLNSCILSVILVANKYFHEQFAFLSGFVIQKSDLWFLN